MVLSACSVHDQKLVTEAAIAPLNDLDIVHTKIPAVLAEARKQPYAVPEEISCDSLLTAIQDLDDVLGPDLDTPATESNPGLIERGSKKAKSSAVSEIRNTAESILPYRKWIRKLSGAERRSKKVAAAIAAGTIRRAFLKGLKASKNCE
ncbi:MAG: hypothetical protein JXA04_00100 [Gammaproteobacteria bacterium]|nr:hypothetical protein [Gammaproteobacteria bacterium]